MSENKIVSRWCSLGWVESEGSLIRSAVWSACRGVPDFKSRQELVQRMQREKESQSGDTTATGASQDESAMSSGDEALPPLPSHDYTFFKELTELVKNSLAVHENPEKFVKAALNELAKESRSMTEDEIRSAITTKAESKYPSGKDSNSVKSGETVSS
ncbi:hypothetical protein I302_108745 [Kwoniella bestiolae CBS 10118]|uniref:Uncharacterized protein n=1 Tax=Kwoniella bestiolae CBS 10118 TaxID=1296100 RepID=A0A1B9FTY6_9TREE|nr:hypothetical protein I302_07882 [Kwoniella bestiolae CBS 10118]OCF22237.1 hypothetical protein I302_07882 [Kwoniella bestiolae CBS 10118]